MGYADKFSGVAEQLQPETEQVVGAEWQQPSKPGPPPVIGEPEKRIPPLPTSAIYGTKTIVSEAGVEEVVPVLYAQPVLKVNRYEGSDADWQELVRWDITEGYVGDLHSISVISDNDEKTRYAIVIGNVDQRIPTDKQTSTPVDFPFRNNDIPGGTSVFIAVLSTDGTAITVDAFITGTERIPQTV